MGAMGGPVAMAAMVLAELYEQRGSPCCSICLVPMAKMVAMVRTVNGFAVGGSPGTSAMIYKLRMVVMGVMGAAAVAVATAVP